MSASIGMYILCAAAGADRASSMYLGGAYHAGGWLWLRDITIAAKRRMEAFGGRLDFVVCKYPWGQGTNDAGEAEPKALDILTMRDTWENGRFASICGDSPMVGKWEMLAFTDWCRVNRVEKFAYIGKAPTAEELEAFRATPRDVEFVTSWFNAMTGCGWRFILDSACYPPHQEASRRFVEFLLRTGAASVWKFHGEAFCTNETCRYGAWPNREDVMCWGENVAWKNSGMPDASSGRAYMPGLLHARATVTDEVRNALNGPLYTKVAANVMDFSDEAMRELVAAWRAGGGA